MSKVNPIDEEYFFDENVLISQTDTKGIITYANRAFCKVSDFTRDELIGKSHNVVRHPDMPKEVFKKMWETLESGRAWNGLLKNLRKDGLYYWVDTEIIPTRNKENEIIGYIAVGKPVSRKNIQEHEEIYNKMLEIQS
jgi:PAS domain S-box-containing protein